MNSVKYGTATDRIILSSYKEQLTYNSSDNKIILFSNGLAYEYNSNTRRLRPFNSVLWYSVLKDDFDIFLLHLDDKIEQLLSMQDKDTECLKDSYSSFSIILSNSTLKVDLDSIRLELLMEYGSEINNSFRKFFEFLKNTYADNEEILKRIVRNQYFKVQ